MLFLLSALAAMVYTVVVAKQVHKIRMNKHYTDKKIAKKDLEPGDHIYVPSQNGSGSPGRDSSRNIIYGFTYHHGVYLGNDEVTDFGSADQKYPVIRPLADFLQSHFDCIYRREYVNAVRTPAQTIAIARKLCRSAKELADLGYDDFEPYHFKNNNCEQYATKLKTAKHWSGQVESLNIFNCSAANKQYQNCNQRGVPRGSSSVPMATHGN